MPLESHPHCHSFLLQPQGRSSTRTMSRNGKGLKLNVSAQSRGNTSRRTADDDADNASPNSSSPGSCVSSEAANSPEAASMVLAGCPRCLMYVMLSEEDPRCPKCKSTVLLDFHNGNSSGSGSGNGNGGKKNKKR